MKIHYASIFTMALAACSNTARNNHVSDITQVQLEYLGKENAIIAEEFNRYDQQVKQECLRLHSKAFKVMNEHFKFVENYTLSTKQCVEEKTSIECKKQAMLRAGQPSEVIRLFEEMNIVEGAILKCMQLQSPLENPRQIAEMEESPQTTIFQSSLQNTAPVLPLFEKTSEDIVRELIDEQIERETFDSVVAIEFYTQWSEPSKSYSPAFESYFQQYTGPVKVFRMDADINPKTAKKYYILGVPSVIFLFKGKMIGQMIGTIDLGSLTVRIRELEEIWEVHQKLKYKESHQGL